MNQLHVLWDLCVKIGRFTIYVGLGETRMKTADQHSFHTETNFLFSLGGLDSQIPRPRGGEPT